MGVVENMSTFKCPLCATETKVFNEGGAARLSEAVNVEALGSLPLSLELEAKVGAAESKFLVMCNKLIVNLAKRPAANKIPIKMTVRA